MDPAIYNGADMGAYRWSQSHTDLDVQVVVPEDVTTCDGLCVRVKPDALLVLHGERPLVDGRLAHAVRHTESFWTLLPRQHIHIQLEKAVPCWWDCLLQGEPGLDMAAMDKSKPLEELPSEEQMKIHELLWRERQKRDARGDAEPGTAGVPPAS